MSDLLFVDLVNASDKRAARRGTLANLTHAAAHTLLTCLALRVTRQ